MTEKLFLEGEDKFSNESRIVKFSLRDWLARSRIQQATAIVAYCSAVDMNQSEGSEVKLRETAKVYHEDDKGLLRKINNTKDQRGTIRDEGSLPGTFKVELNPPLKVDGDEVKEVKLDGNLLVEDSPKWREALESLEKLRISYNNAHFGELETKTDPERLAAGESQ